MYVELVYTKFSVIVMPPVKDDQLPFACIFAIVLGSCGYDPRNIAGEVSQIENLRLICTLDGALAVDNDH